MAAEELIEDIKFPSVASYPFFRIKMRNVPEKYVRSRQVNDVLQLR